MTVREAIEDAGRSLRAAGCDSPHVDAELLLRHALHLERTELYADSGRTLTAEEEERFRSLLARRERREPVAYILGEWGFRGLELSVGPHVLVPRPETETLVDRALTHIAEVTDPRVLDIGTGSGAIALAVASEHPGAHVVATDISADALAVAAENRARTGLEGKVELVLGHLDAGVKGPFDLVVSNPPYVLPDEVERLEPEVRIYEPREAVVGTGQTDAIARRAREALRPGGWLVLETSEYRAQEVAAELRALGYEEVAVHRDLAGCERVVEGRLA